MFGQVTAPWKLNPLGEPAGWPQTRKCEGAQIFQTSHRQIAEDGRGVLLTAAGLYFLHKIRLNSEHLNQASRLLCKLRGPGLLNLPSSFRR